MLKKRLIIFVFMGIIGFGFIIATPIGVVSVIFSSYSTINKSRSFEYLPDNPSATGVLNLNVDFGNIEINYIDPPVNYQVKIDVHIKMAGAGLVGKDYLDYFIIDEGDTTGSSINFSLKILPNITESEIDDLVKDVSIIISLRKDIVFNISTAILYGNVGIFVPFRVKINSLNVNITHGNMLFDLRNCIVGGDITGILNNGKIIFISDNAEYTQNSEWTLYSNKNYIHIAQDESMGANITGTIITTEDVGTRLIFIDSTLEVGAKFTLFDYRFPQIQNGTLENFYFYEVPEGINRYCYVSNDFPANYSYNLDLFLGGILNFNLFSA